MCFFSERLLILVYESWFWEQRYIKIRKSFTVYNSYEYLDWFLKVNFLGFFQEKKGKIVLNISFIVWKRISYSTHVGKDCKFSLIQQKLDIASVSQIYLKFRVGLQVFFSVL